MSRRKRWAFRGLTILFLFVLIETLAAAGVWFLKKRGVIFEPVKTDYARYLMEHDPILGWPRRTPDSSRDKSGARISLAFPDRNSHPPAVSVYGDSFTWSDEVGHESAWPEVLSTMINARVDNFGVSGYGSDQALLRYVNNDQESAPVVLLVHLSENILRNVNQYRELLYRSAGTPNCILLKPRFAINSDSGLELVPLPEIRLQDYDRFTKFPEEFLTNETFAPGQPEGSIRARFPFTMALARSLFHFRVVSKLRGEPWHSRFYQPGHHAQGVSVTASILQDFHDAATRRGQSPVVAILPTGPDLEYNRRTGHWVYEPLLAELQERQIPVLDFGPRLQEKFAGQDLNRFYHKLNGHHNERGYRFAAEIVHEYLTAAKLISVSGGAAARGPLPKIVEPPEAQDAGERPGALLKNASPF